MHWECRYCDRPAGYMGIPITVGDEEICVCGAEWADAKIWIEDDEVNDDDPWLNDYRYEDELELEDDTYECGCKRDDGCYCDLYDRDDEEIEDKEEWRDKK